MYVSMCVGMHVYAYMYVCTLVYALIYACIHVCMYACVHACRPHDTIHTLNIANIRNIDLLLATPPQYLLTPVNIYEFLLPP